SVSNAALEHDLKALAGAKSDDIHRDVYQSYQSHFTASRINADSIRLLLRYARDRDEVKRILSIAVQALELRPEVLRKTQVDFLRALSKFITVNKPVSGANGSNLVHLSPTEILA